MNSVSLREPSFERIRPIGSGSTGRVELVRLLEPWSSLAAGTELALKTLALKSSAAGSKEALVAERAFRAEALAGAQVDDPSLVKVLHQGQSGEELYLLME